MSEYSDRYSAPVDALEVASAESDPRLGLDRSNPALASAGEVFFLPSADFWLDQAPQLRTARYLAFDLADATFAVPLAHVREVDRLPAVTPLPNVPRWLLGAANLRGEILSVVDLTSFLGLVSSRPPRDARLLAARAGSMEVGLVVERVRDIRELPDASIRPPAGPITGRAARYLSGVHAGDGRLTLVLDVPRLLHSPELRRFE